jgi:uncharacterized surface protein with fasciclin (FAS1) repeats
MSNKKKSNKKSIMKLIKKSIFLIAASLFTLNVMAQDIVDVAVSSKAHTTLVAAVKAAGLVETLKSKGPFTVFAPTNDAFAKLPAGTVEGLLKPESKGALTGILTYHVVAGNLDAKAVLAAIKKGGGKVTASVVEGKVILTDENGGKATVTATDLKGSNGIIHVIDAVLLPKSK